MGHGTFVVRQDGSSSVMLRATAPGTRPNLAVTRSRRVSSGIVQAITVATSAFAFLDVVLLITSLHH
jgi:hypothetical protein